MSFASFAKQHIPRYQPPVQSKPTGKFKIGSEWRYVYDGIPSSFILIYTRPGAHKDYGYFQYSTAYPNGESWKVDYTDVVPA